jgi:tRNA(fMet)-specific endonuclease VapC
LAVLLDTDHISILQHGEWPAVDVLRSRLKQLPVTDVRVTIVSFQEQVQGWLAYLRRARKRPETLKGFSKLLMVLRDYSEREILPFDERAMDEFLALQQQRIRIGTNDLRIAAIAKANGVKLLSRNLRDFRLVPGLDVEDWTT